MRISDWSSDVCSSDLDVGKFLRLFTDLPLDEIARLETLDGAAINEAKKILANEATAMCRGAEAARAAAETAAQTFEKGHVSGDLPQVAAPAEGLRILDALRSEEHTSELQSLMRQS